MSYYNSRVTEECPLTKDKNYGYKLSTYCGGGLKFIITCFAILTIAITTTLILQLLYAEHLPQDQAGFHGAVATDYTNCSQIGTKLLRKGGNAVDAAVAATVCMTVVAPQKTSLGGGGIIMIYNHKSRMDPLIIDFGNNTMQGTFAKKGIRLPAVLKGLELAHLSYGLLPWRKVIEPAVNLAREGFVVSKELASEVSKDLDYESFYGHLNAGDILKLDDVAETLNYVAQYGTSVFYNGTLSRKIFPDNDQAELLLELADYQPEIITAEKSVFYKHIVYHPPHTFYLESIIKSLNNLKMYAENASSIKSQVLVAQTLLQSISLPLEIIQKVEEERYTGVVAMDWHDTYICILTGTSTSLGNGNMTKAGFLLDKIDGDNDLSTFVPIVFRDEEVPCGLRGVFGTDDIFFIGQLLQSLIVRMLNVSTAIEYPRYYPSTQGIVLENDQNHSMEDSLHMQLISIIPTLYSDALVTKSINAIIKRKDSMVSHSDSRAGGLASRF
ncbi:hypothetical protein KM043_006188 [Ampulex compressa]|nr:hypothetical protein KM043_006188 [Ampulex compressa]